MGISFSTISKTIWRDNYSSRVLWKVDGQEIFIKKESNEEWIKIENGRRTFEYQFLRWDGNSLFLLKRNDYTSVKIDSNSYKEGINQDSININFYSGTWVNPSDHEIYGKLWKKKNNEFYISRQSATKWVEYCNGFKCCEYDFIRKENDSVYLKKVGWMMYVKLDNLSYVFGQTIDNLDSPVFSGNWVNPLDYSNRITEKKTYGQLWKVEGKEVYFKKHKSNMWIKYDDNREVSRYVFIKSEEDSVYLQKIGSPDFIRINSDSVKIGNDMIDLNRSLHIGVWTDSLNFSIGLNEVTRPSSFWRVIRQDDDNDNDDVYFREESELRWAGYRNGIRECEFYLIKTEGDAVFLKQIGSQLFARIDSSTFESGNSPCQINSVDYHGTWISRVVEPVDAPDVPILH